MMQIFKISVEDAKITPELISGLLRVYFNDMQYRGSVTVEEAHSSDHANKKVLVDVEKIRKLRDSLSEVPPTGFPAASFVYSLVDEAIVFLDTLLKEAP